MDAKQPQLLEAHTLTRTESYQLRCCSGAPGDHTHIALTRNFLNLSTLSSIQSQKYFYFDYLVFLGSWQDKIVTDAEIHGNTFYTHATEHPDGKTQRATHILCCGKKKEELWMSSSYFTPDLYLDVRTAGCQQRSRFTC